MKKLYNVPTDEQLIKVADLLSETLSDIKKDSMSIVFKLDENIIKQIDESYYIKNNKDTDLSNFIPASEVEINISGIKFKFVSK